MTTDLESHVGGMNPPLPGMGESGSPGLPLAGGMLAELAALGAGNEAARVLQSVPLAEREKVHRFFVHFYGGGRARVLPTFERLADEAAARGWPRPLGGLTLAGWSRGTQKDFELSNDFAAFYVVALHLLRPGLAGHLQPPANLPGLLLGLGWNPFTDGRKERAA